MEKQLIPYIINESGEVIVSGRELHNFVQIKTPYKINILSMYTINIYIKLLLTKRKFTMT